MAVMRKPDFAAAATTTFLVRRRLNIEAADVHLNSYDHCQQQTVTANK